jgi:hypothetical protein
MSDTDWSSAIAAVASLGVTVEDAGNALVEAFGNRNEVIETMLDGTPIVDAAPMVFQRNGIWYCADGTPIED